MPKKSVLEFLSIADAFPTSIADAIGNGWTPHDVHDVVQEMFHLAGISKEIHPAPVYGALDPKIIPHKIIKPES